MHVYVFQAALICDTCGTLYKQGTDRPAHVDENDESSYDSDEWPKGPYSDGGGEADCPQHCDHCGVFLDNPLTGDGSAYVKNEWLEYAERGYGSLPVLLEWREAYPCEFAEFGEAFEEGDYGEQSELALRRFGDLVAR